MPFAPFIGVKYIPPDVGAKLVQRLSNPELSERELGTSLTSTGHE